MPRLLLVDDNPSIHRIAESLLAPTDVVLVCVDSAAEALDRIGRGEHFDVALVDTAMPGMDGWTLLNRLRAMDETARMPIALMAGVLDPVDPAKLAKAPIQGFLKKPIELRELGDRVKALLATPVSVSPSPFSTVPATPARDLVKRAEPSLPEFRPEFEEEPKALAEVEPADDLLLLTEEDLWPAEVAPVVPEVVPVMPEAGPQTPFPPDVQLELEELDLDSLQDLTGEPLSEMQPITGNLPETTFEFEPLHRLPVEEDHLVTLSGLEELETMPPDFDLLPSSPATHTTQELVEKDDFLAHLPVVGSLIGVAGVAAVVGMAAHEPALELHDLAPKVHQEPEAPLKALESVPTPAASGQTHAAPGHVTAVSLPQTPVTAEQARAVVQAMVADPVLIDALVKAVVARMGDQVLREIAWEVMPDLAGRLQR